jgi:hypothetical protein
MVSKGEGGQSGGEIGEFERIMSATDFDFGVESDGVVLPSTLSDTVRVGVGVQEGPYSRGQSSERVYEAGDQSPTQTTSGTPWNGAPNGAFHQNMES